MKTEAVKSLLYGCLTYTPLKGHYNKPRTAHQRMLLENLGASCKSASENWQRKREAEEAGEVEVAHWVTLESLIRLRGALIGPTQGLPK